MLNRQHLQDVFIDLLSKITGFAEKVEPIFKANNWTWLDKKPTALDIDSLLESLAYSAMAELKKDADSKACCSSGRLQVRLVNYKGLWKGYLELVPEYVII
jgi:hypothetical protein